MSTLSDLKRLRGAWREIKVSAAGGKRVTFPDGKYPVRIVGADRKKDKTGGEGILWTFEALRGSQKGNTLAKWSGLRDSDGEFLEESRIKWVARDFATLLGEPLDDITTIDDVLSDLLDKTTEVQVKTKGEFTNVYINSLATDGADSEEEETEDTDEEDEKPKRKAAVKDDDDDEEDDDDEPTPKKRVTVDDDDDEDEAPKKKKVVDEDEEEEDTEEEVARLLSKNKKTVKRK